MEVFIAIKMNELKLVQKLLEQKINEIVEIVFRDRKSIHIELSQYFKMLRQFLQDRLERMEKRVLFYFYSPYLMQRLFTDEKFWKILFKVKNWQKFDQTFNLQGISNYLVEKNMKSILSENTQYLLGLNELKVALQKTQSIFQQLFNQPFYKKVGISYQFLKEHQIKLSFNTHIVKFVSQQIQINANRYDEKSKQFAKEIKAQGDKMYQQKNYQQAYQLYKKAIELYPNYLPCINRLGNTLHHLKDYENAIKFFDQALSLQENGLFYYNRGNSYRCLKNYIKSIQDYNESLRLIPNHILSFINEGISLRHLGRFPEAIQCFDNALILNHKDDIGYFNKGLCYRDMEIYKIALQNIDKAIFYNSENKSYFKEKYQILKRIGDQVQANQTQQIIEKKWS